MMKRILLLFSTAFCFTACVDFGASTPAPLYRTLLPGECLSSTELTYFKSNASGILFKELFRFDFTLDMGGYVREKIYPGTLSRDYRFAPSEEIYELFAPNNTIVKQDFDQIYWDFCHGFDGKYHMGKYSVATILYCGGISLTADKDFAGYPAGTDLGPMLKNQYSYDVYGKEIVFDVNTVIADSRHSKEDAGTFIDLPMDYIGFTYANVIEFGFPVGDCSLTDEHVTFDLEIPVKVVMYLHWLNDKLSDPNAPVPYKEEVLHCHFTVENGLKKPS